MVCQSMTSAALTRSQKEALGCRSLAHRQHHGYGSSIEGLRRSCLYFRAVLMICEMALAIK